MSDIDDIAAKLKDPDIAAKVAEQLQSTNTGSSKKKTVKYDPENPDQFIEDLNDILGPIQDAIGNVSDEGVVEKAVDKKLAKDKHSNLEKEWAEIAKKVGNEDATKLVKKMEALYHTGDYETLADAYNDAAKIEGMDTIEKALKNASEREANQKKEEQVRLPSSIHSDDGAPSNLTLKTEVKSTRDAIQQNINALPENEKAELAGVE